MSTIKFSSTRILPAGKKGVLTPDSDGYYTTVLGGLNCYNSAGAYYPLTDEVRKLFEESSIFMRRIRKGVLKAELGHPKQSPGMSDMDYYQRIMDIDEKCVCAHISSIWLDEEYGKKHPELKNPNLVAVMGKVAPSGPYASTLKTAMENSKENCCFSVRSITEDRWEGGRTNKTIKTIITYDFVNEPGISIATKYDSPSLESYKEPTVLALEYERPVTVSQLQRLSKTCENKLSASLEATSMINEVIQTFIKKPDTLPAYTKW